VGADRSVARQHDVDRDRATGVGRDVAPDHVLVARPDHPHPQRLRRRRHHLGSIGPPHEGADVEDRPRAVDAAVGHQQRAQPVGPRRAAAREPGLQIRSATGRQKREAHPLVAGQHRHHVPAAAQARDPERVGDGGAAPLQRHLGAPDRRAGAPARDRHQHVVAHGVGADGQVGAGAHHHRGRALRSEVVGHGRAGQTVDHPRPDQPDRRATGRGVDVDLGQRLRVDRGRARDLGQHLRRRRQRLAAADRFGRALDVALVLRHRPPHHLQAPHVAGPHRPLREHLGGGAGETARAGHRGLERLRGQLDPRRRDRAIEAVDQAAHRHPVPAGGGEGALYPQPWGVRPAVHRHLQVRDRRLDGDGAPRGAGR
jgi:hypothetical protein